MSKISHNDAVSLEKIIGDLYKCDRGGVSGLCDADNFEHQPIDAAIMAVSYIYSHNLETNNARYEEFINKYRWIFENPEQGNAKNEAINYIKELRKIISFYK